MQKSGHAIIHRKLTFIPIKGQNFERKPCCFLLLPLQFPAHCIKAAMLNRQQAQSENFFV